MMQTLYVLPGWGQDKTHWQGIIDLFATSNIAIQAIDLPGFGTEKLVNEHWNVADYAAWVVEKIGKENLESGIILGHSFGGRVSAYLVGSMQVKPKALILYGAPVIYRPTLTTVLKSKLAHLLKPIIPASLKTKLYHYDLRDAINRGMEQIFRRSVVFDQTEILAKISVPTYLIWGENDDSVPLRIAQEMEGLIAGSQLLQLPDLGHNAHLESPQLFYGTIKKICENH